MNKGVEKPTMVFVPDHRHDPAKNKFHYKYRHKPKVNDDEIYVPENFNYIEILGGILKPGRYPFSNNRTFDEYIKLAGGKSRTATRDIFIIKSGTGQRLPANRDIIIENGDTIFIADKMEYNKWIILKDILTTLGSVAALIVVIQSAIGT